MEDRRLEFLRDAVEALSLESEGQLQLLRQGQAPVDELALSFDDLYLAVPAMLADGAPLNDEALDAMQRLDGLLAAMSGPGHADVWTEAALVTDDRWRAVREAAAAALQFLPTP